MVTTRVCFLSAEREYSTTHPFARRLLRGARPAEAPRQGFRQSGWSRYPPQAKRLPGGPYYRPVGGNPFARGMGDHGGQIDYACLPIDRRCLNRCDLVLAERLAHDVKAA